MTNSPDTMLDSILPGLFEIQISADYIRFFGLSFHHIKVLFYQKPVLREGKP